MASCCASSGTRKQRSGSCRMAGRSSFSQEKSEFIQHLKHTEGHYYERRTSEASYMKTLLDLGTQPLVNTLCGSAEDALAAARFRLRATVDDDLLIRLDDESTVAPDVLYKDYVYRSGVSQPYITHCERMAEMFVGCRRGVVIDVGGNDGTLLKAFKRTMGIKTLINVDASENLREENEKDGIKYVQGFFDAAMDLPKADIITSTNVFQHTADARKFLRAVAAHLHEDGHWLLEFPYTMRTLESLLSLPLDE